MERTSVTMDPVNPAQPSGGGALAPPFGGEGYSRGEGGCGSRETERANRRMLLLISHWHLLDRLLVLFQIFFCVLSSSFFVVANASSGFVHHDLFAVIGLCLPLLCSVHVCCLHGDRPNSVAGCVVSTDKC